jgi:hypothetical protein
MNQERKEPEFHKINLICLRTDNTPFLRLFLYTLATTSSQQEEEKNEKQQNCQCRFFALTDDDMYIPSLFHVNDPVTMYIVRRAENDLGEEFIHNPLQLPQYIQCHLEEDDDDKKKKKKRILMTGRAIGSLVHHDQNGNDEFIQHKISFQGKSIVLLYSRSCACTDCQRGIEFFGDITKMKQSTKIFSFVLQWDTNDTRRTESREAVLKNP